MSLMKMHLIIFSLLLAITPAWAQSDKPMEASEVPTVTFCDLVNNPEIFDKATVRFRATYLSNSEVATFVDQSCMAKDRRTWAEFDGISIKASAPSEIYERVQEQILCGKCGDDNHWRETEMLVTGIFNADDTRHGRLGKYRFMVMVTNVEEIGETAQAETTRFDPR